MIRVAKRRLATVPSLINGKHVLSSQKLPVYAPSGEIPYHYSPVDIGETSVSEICQNASIGFHEWSSRSFQDRSETLNLAADIILKNLADYIDAHKSIGASHKFATTIAQLAVLTILEYAACISRPPGSLLHTVKSEMALSVNCPVGPVLAMAAWNAPTVLWARAVVAPLAAGCSVVLLATEQDPRIPFLLNQHLLEAGVNPKALQTLQLAPGHRKKATELFLEDDNIRMVNFTGSTEVGRLIAQVAAKHLKPTLLELGGKNVSIVCKDADIRAAAQNVLFSAWLHSGQICMCLDQVYVHEDIEHEFTDHLRTIAAQMVEDPDFQLMQRTPQAAERVKEMLIEATNTGARLIHGEISGSPGRVTPVILNNVHDGTTLSLEETFAPVLVVSLFSSLKALTLSIKSQKSGLKASVWSKDIMGAIDVAKRLEFGGVHINGSSIHDEATLPHGGVKESGYGRFNSGWGINEFTYTKVITINR